MVCGIDSVRTSADRKEKNDKSMAANTESFGDHLYSIHTSGRAGGGTPVMQLCSDYVKSILVMGIACVKLRAMKPVHLVGISKGLPGQPHRALLPKATYLSPHTPYYRSWMATLGPIVKASCYALLAAVVSRQS